MGSWLILSRLPGILLQSTCALHYRLWSNIRETNMKRLQIALLLLVVGCQGKYYRVTLPQSGKTFYTKKIYRRTGGAAKFKDERTGANVTLQSSEVSTISKSEFEKATSAEEKK